MLFVLPTGPGQGVCQNPFLALPFSSRLPLPLRIRNACNAEFAVMSGNSNPFPWRSRLATWSGGRIDWTLKPFETIITSRPHDLLMMVNKNAPCPRQYVWVYEFNDDAVLRPDWAAEPSSMSLKHLGFLSFLKISAISNPHFPASLYLRWELVPTAKEALLL